MVERITMDKGNFLGYGNLEDLELIGRTLGYDVYVEKEERTSMTVWVYDRNVTKRVRHIEGYMETRYRIAAKIDMSKETVMFFKAYRFSQGRQSIQGQKPCSQNLQVSTQETRHYTDGFRY